MVEVTCDLVQAKRSSFGWPVDFVFNYVPLNSLDHMETGRLSSDRQDKPGKMRKDSSMSRHFDFSLALCFSHCVFSRDR